MVKRLACDQQQDGEYSGTPVLSLHCSVGGTFVTQITP